MGNLQDIISALMANKGQQVSAPQGQWQGNGVFMNQGRASIPAGSVADRLMAGNFGPSPNNTAPPGFRIPEIVSAILNGGGGGQTQPQAAPAAPQTPQMAFDNLSNENGIGYGFENGQRYRLDQMAPGSWTYNRGQF